MITAQLVPYELQASAPLEERRAAVETTYPQGSGAAEDHIDGYVDYQTAALRLEVPQDRGDRSSYYGQGWQACAQQGLVLAAEKFWSLVQRRRQLSHF